jgi:hypothetical protein
MVFTRDSIIVKTWVTLVVSGVYTREQVPNLFNLQSVVWGILDELVA